MAMASVASGAVVGNCIVFRSVGPVPTPQTNLVPPASIEPNIISICAPRSLPQNLAGTKFQPPQKTSEDVNGHASQVIEITLDRYPCPAHRRFRPPHPGLAGLRSAGW